MQHLWSYSIQWAWATFLTQASTVALTLLTFVLYPFLSSTSGSSPPAAQALSGLALINQFTVPLTIIPVIVPELIAACNSTFRLQEFFRKSDISVQRHQHPADKPAANESLSVRTLEKIAEDEEHQEAGSDNFYEQPEELAVRISQATFSWHPVESSLKLHDINLDIPRGRLTAIVGHVGSGKSSLLMAMLGELDIQAGSLTWSSSASIQQLGYAAQRPWLMHASLRDNILFGSVLYAKRYGKVLEACALTPDLESLPQRDATLIGSKGQNVSGGQRARISLARAIYSPATTLLLDDPFAALDLPVKTGSGRKEDEMRSTWEHGSHQRWKRRSSLLNALPIHMSHDLPLLTDEMTIDEFLPDAGCDRPYGSKSLRTRHLSSLNGPLPETLPSAPQQPRSSATQCQ